MVKEVSTSALEEPFVDVLVVVVVVMGLAVFDVRQQWYLCRKSTTYSLPLLLLLFFPPSLSCHHCLLLLFLLLIAAKQEQETLES